MIVNIIVTVAVSILVMAGAGAVAASVNTATNVQVHANGYNKDQCKNGGWQALGFKNQGQCVSFFASGGRAPGQ